VPRHISTREQLCLQNGCTWNVDSCE
jgi:hypothetical protein